MKVNIVSDLHLEFSGIELHNKNDANVLILSGDIMLANDLHDHQPQPHLSYEEASKLGHRLASAVVYRNFLHQCSSRFDHVVYVAGNHEFYNGRFYGSLDHLREECARYDNVHFMEKDAFEYMNVTFVGGTLWTDCNKYDPLTLHAIRDMLNDFSLIRNDQKGFRAMSPADTAVRHRETLAYIRQVILNIREQKGPDHKVVVVGHHSPSLKSISPMYAHDTLMNGAYHSDLSEFILDHPEIVLWTHGHTHHSFDYEIGTTRIICNPRGYGYRGNAENHDWDPDLTVEL